ncbi:helix-turn-helix domain-containing protein [Mucilaginibacter sp. X4EP1]|uniref:helix-turn-helix domain-containing protein n=1 Tax=Mucilaginibacter sp. X4EP1 TaxID=2723092 RepID=UPI00216852DB|nr:helix-turn-helix transcriptional regulator [Mucilaginibacter sp. X4EP1]
MGVSQQSISRMKQSEVLEDDVLEKIAKILGVTPEAIKNFSEKALVNYLNTLMTTALIKALCMLSIVHLILLKKLWSSMTRRCPFRTFFTG